MADLVARQRAVIERLLLAALRERDLTTDALEAGRRAAFLAEASRALALSLDSEETREAVRHRALPREGSWCIVDIVELDGSARRLPVAHPYPAKQDLAQTFADRWLPLQPDEAVAAADVDAFTSLGEPDFGGLLVVPLVVRELVLGAITFMTKEGDRPFSPNEVTLASDLADVCALALDNASLYRQAQLLRDAADAANRAKSTFLGNMSHELRTPLNAIGGYVTLLEMGLRGPVTAEQRIDLGRIQHNQAHLLALISEVLTFVRSESGRLEYRFGNVSVAAAMEEVADMLHGAADERHVALVYSTGGSGDTVFADPDRVRQILLNLLTNALKYASGPGGRITLGSTTTSDAVAMYVADDGPGIPPERLAAIFDPFVQLPSGLSDRRGGIGLGLAISRDLARAMHGDLTVESTVGAGSRFILKLPRVKALEAP